jgi:hypothetical protein
MCFPDGRALNVNGLVRRWRSRVCPPGRDIWHLVAGADARRLTAGPQP